MEELSAEESEVSEPEASDSLLFCVLLWLSDWLSVLSFNEESSAELSVVPSSEESASLFRESFCVSPDGSSVLSELSSVMASSLLLSVSSFLELLPPNRSLKKFLILPQNPLSSLLSSEVSSEAALTVAAFDVVLKWVESGIRNITAFMGVFYPVYFLAVAVAKGSVTGVAFYNLVLFLIYAVEIIIGNVLLPMVRVYMIIRILNFLGPEDMLEKLSEFLEIVIRWTLKTALACVIGANLIQGMISPAIDTVKRSTVLKGAEAIPGIGNLLGGMTEVALGTAVLVKNGIGMAGAVICIALCVIPLVQTAGTALLYKLAAAMIQPVSDERVTGCVEAVGEGCQILMQIVFTVGVLFLLTIAIVAAVTNA